MINSANILHLSRISYKVRSLSAFVVTSADGEIQGLLGEEENCRRLGSAETAFRTALENVPNPSNQIARSLTASEEHTI